MPVANGAPYVQLLNQAVGIKLLTRVKVVAPGGLPQDVLDQLGESVVGMEEPASAVLLTNPASHSVAEAYQKVVGRAPAEQGLQSYVGMNLLLQAVAATPTPTPTADGVRAALQAGSFKTIVGTVGFRPGDQQLLSPVWPATVQKLAIPIAGAAYGFVATGQFTAEDLLPPIGNTGCRPLP